MIIVTHTTRGVSEDALAALNNMTATFAKALRLDSSRFGLQIYCIPNLLRDHGHKGAVTMTGPREITALIDSKLLKDLEALATVVGHEFVHVKQYAKGQLVQKLRKNKPAQFLWLGKTCKKSYYERPWELEAFGRQQILANMIAA